MTYCTRRYAEPLGLGSSQRLAADVLSRNHIEVPIDDTPALCDWLDAMIEPPLVLHRALIEENTEPIEPVDYKPPKKAPARKPRGKRASD